MFKIQKTPIPLKGYSYLILIVLVNSIATTMLIPVFPIYIKNLVGSNATVGYVSAFISFLLILYTLLARKLLQKTRKQNLLRIGFLGSSATLLIFTLLTNIKQFLVLELFRTFFLVAVYITIGFFVREYATVKSMGKAEGRYFTVANMGWLIGPLLGGLLASAYSFKMLFVITAVVQLLISLTLFMVPLKERQVKISHEIRFVNYFKNKDLVTLYIVQFGLVAWWAILYTFMPLFANTNGFTTKIIGYAMFAAVMPLVIFEIPVGRLADEGGIRKYITLGFLVIAVISAFAYFTSPFYTIVLIVAATIGTIFIEPLLEAYFFERVKSRESQNAFYPVYKTSSEISNIIFPVIFSTILIYYGFKTAFLFTAFLMLLFSLLALRLKK